MALPEREYYPLFKVAEIMKCDIEDLLHYASIGLLQICFPIPLTEMFSNKVCDNESEYVFPSVVRDEISNIPEEGRVYRFRNNYFSMYEFVLTSDKRNDLKMYGLLAINYFDIAHFYDFYLRTEYEADCLFVCSADFPRDNVEPFVSEGYKPINIEFSDEYCIDLHRLVITKYELTLLQLGGKKYIESEAEYIDDEKELEYFLKNKTNDLKNPSHYIKSNLQIEFIRNLLFLKYGEDAIKNPRNFIEKNKSPLVRDFELNGLKYPSGKSLEKWLKK